MFGKRRHHPFPATRLRSDDPTGGILALTLALAMTLSLALSLLAFPASGKRPRPDLVVRSVSEPPAAADAGSSIAVQDVTKNVGAVKASPSRTRYYLSLDDARGGDILLAGAHRVKALRPRKRSRGDRDVGVPVSTPVGSYRLLACADDTQANTEADEQNNCRASVSEAQIYGPGVFVSTQGGDSNPGTRGAPKRTIQAAIATAATQAPPGDVYVATGSYERVELVTGVDILGGFDPSSWGSSAAATSIVGVPEAVAANGVSGVSLADLSIAGAQTQDSSYAILAIDSSLSLERVLVSAANAGDGAAGTSPPGVPAPGNDGSRGDPGVEDSSGFCTQAARPGGGPGGTSPVGRAGGRGGAPGKGSGYGDVGAPGSVVSATGGAGGAGVAPGGNPSLMIHQGQVGDPGGPGANGGAGAASFLSSGYSPSAGGSGTQGQPGSGGGGGGGGGGGSTDCDSYGGGGGGGGGGGAGGQAAGGGTSGGASIALYLWNSTLDGDQVSLAAGDGGDGGAGGTGQPGGGGGAGGLMSVYGGGSEQDDATNGAAGGAGGPGGRGGHGGGGGGGPSIAVFLGNGSTADLVASSYTLGQPGTGGASPGNAGPTGFAVETYAP